MASPPYFSQAEQSLVAHMSSSPNSGQKSVTKTQLVGGRTGKRRVHDDGLTMLNEHYAFNREKQKLQQMENRVKRLQFEENRARKMSELAQEKAENLIHARNRHFMDLITKKNFYA